MEKLRKIFPQGEDCAVFLVLSPELAARKTNALPEDFCNDLLARFQLPASSPDPAGNELLSKGVAAAFAGDEKNGILLLYSPLPREKILKLLERNAGKLSPGKEEGIEYYGGGAAGRNFLFAFPSSDVIAFSEDSPKRRAVFFRYLKGKKGLAPEMQDILKERRKGAFVFGAVKVSGVQKTVSTFFPDTGSLLSAGFDALLTKEGCLSIHLFAKTASLETAETLVMVLNNYKALLSSLLLSARNNAQARNGGKMSSADAAIDPDTMIQLRQKGETVYVEILLLPSLVPMMQTLFLPGSGAAGQGGIR
ncbi:MAG: hypothetical protein J6A21_10485 [Lentisphaeria bacterium]|nr:hypothetical protein [Lentisphaeria bacterium]